MATRTGLNIISGCGYYVAPSHPPQLQDATVENITEELISCVSEGIEGTNVKAGIIGEIGVSPKMTKTEEKVLRAAAQTHLATSAPINVHVDPFGKEGNRVLDVLEAEGVEPARVIFSHMDVVLDLDYETRLAGRGAILEYDDFGEEEYIDAIGFSNPRDAERVAALKKLEEAGYIDQLMISQDVCMKMYTKTFGGAGYDHILRNVVYDEGDRLFR